VQLKHDIHLAYCTNIHRGQNWAETFDTLVKYVLAVRDRVSPGKPYAIGLRLSNQAAVELSDRKTLAEFQRWLEKENSYVFTINGFPYGTFHGGRVKELATGCTRWRRRRGRSPSSRQVMPTALTDAWQVAATCSCAAGVRRSLAPSAWT